MFWNYLLIAVICYCIGNINPGIILSRLIYKKDLRDYGSGNAGTTNAFRIFGAPFGITVMLIDISKGALSVWLGSQVIFKDGNLTAMVIAGLFAVLGHIYPALFKFRGGKGVATVGGMLIMLDWRMFLCMLAVFIVILITTRYMSVASMSTFITGPLSAYCICRFVDGLPMSEVWRYMLAAFIFGTIIVLTHHENIRRLIAGNENRLGEKKEQTE